MKKILINANQKEESRLAFVNDNLLFDLQVDIRTKPQYRSNIYLGIVTHIENSLEAIFIEYGGNRNGFLPFKELTPNYYSLVEEKTISENELSEDLPDKDDDDLTPKYKKSPNKKRPKIQPNLNIGDKVIVQVDKEERGTKGAALTCYISLPGRYLVFLPFNNAVGISRRINENRDDIKDKISQLTIPNSSGVIIRTVGADKKLSDLQYDLDHTVAYWNKLIEASKEAKQTPLLLISENDLTTQLVRDYLRDDIDEVIIDDETVYEKSKQMVEGFVPDYLDKIKFYNGQKPLFSYFNIEKQIQEAYMRRVNLKSGGILFFDITEALIAVDVNSAKATNMGDIEETALQTNLEAAEEIARQLRIRDMGGLIVIDFIDMGSSYNQNLVEKHLVESLQYDRARIQVGKISSKFGLLQMSRQRIGKALHDVGAICHYCSGTGTLPNIDNHAISIFRVIEEEASDNSRTKEILLVADVEVVSYISNNKRQDLIDIEKKFEKKIYIDTSVDQHFPHYKLLRKKEPHHSWEVVINTMEVLVLKNPKDNKHLDKIPAISFDLPNTAPVVPFWKKLLSIFKKSETTTATITENNKDMTEGRRDARKSYSSKNYRDGYSNRKYDSNRDSSQRRNRRSSSYSSSRKTKKYNYD